VLGLYEVFYAVSIFIRLIADLILIYCVLSWFQPRFKLFFTLRNFILPFVSPFQRLGLAVRKYFAAPIDFTYLFALIGYRVLNWLWWMLYGVLARIGR